MLSKKCRTFSNSLIKRINMICCSNNLNENFNIFPNSTLCVQKKINDTLWISYGNILKFRGSETSGPESVISKIMYFNTLNPNHSQGKFSRRQIDYFFFVFFFSYVLFLQKTGFDVSCKGNSLHDMSNPIFGKKNKQNISKYFNAAC